MEAGRRTLKEMRKLGYRPDLITFNTLVSGFAAAGDIIMAKAAIGELELLVKLVVSQW